MTSLAIVILSSSIITSTLCGPTTSAKRIDLINEQNTDELFPVSIIHINDFHARFEETNWLSSFCKSGDEHCIGGYARAITVIKQLMKTNLNPIYLNAGDSFQGTPWYTFGRWNVTSELFNLLPADAITLGNHDFDNGINGVVPFMESLKSPVILANVDDTLEPMFQHKYKKSWIIERYNRKIGVIGVILKNVHNLADTGNLRFTNETIAIRQEAAKLKMQNVDIIIVLSHCGLATDYIIAKECISDIDVIVGGHSHTFMYTTMNENERTPGPDTAQDFYPAVVRDDENDENVVLIVQASAFLKYVGNITVWFDRNGHAVKWEGSPIFLETSIEPDAEVNNAMQPWKQLIDANGSQILSYTNQSLLRTPCHSHECILGDVLTDAFAYYYRNTRSDRKINQNSSNGIISFITCGSIHGSLNADSITYNDLSTILPFGNTIDTFELRGDHLMEILEHAVDESWRNNTFIGKWLLQVSGLRIVYNMTNPINNRVVSAEVLQINDNNVDEFKPLDLNVYYKCIAESFLVKGGDGFETIAKHKTNHHIGPMEMEAILPYFKTHKTIDRELEGRLTFLE